MAHIDMREVEHLLSGTHDRERHSIYVKSKVSKYFRNLAANVSFSDHIVIRLGV